MTETKTVCDRCGKVINGLPRVQMRRKRAKILELFVRFTPVHSSCTRKKIDLCPECYGQFKNWLEEKEED